MQKSTKMILSGAILAALPTVSHAAYTFTVTLDTTVLKYGVAGTSSANWASLPTGTTAPTSGIYFNTTSDTAYIPAGDGVVVGYDGSVASTVGTAALGVAGFGFGISNTAPTVAFPQGYAGASGAALFTTNTPAFNASFTGGNFVADTTKSNATGGVTPPGAAIGTEWSSASTTPVTWLPAGGSGIPSLLVSNLEFDTASTAATGTTSTFALTNPTTGNLYRNEYAFNTLPTQGTAGSTTGSDSVLTSGTDTMNLTGATFSVAVAGVGTTTTTSTAHPIVGLSNGSTGSTANYGSQIGNPISITAHAPGQYTVGYTGTTLNQSGGQGYTTGYTAVSAFNPLTDTEVYALKLNASGAALSPTSTEIALIVADLNLSASNVSAGAVAGSAYASLFPGYDILLTSTAGFSAGAGGVADLGIDFTQDSDALTPGLVVTEVAAVPEPATAAGVVLGAAGLLLGRRKKQMATA